MSSRRSLLWAGLGLVMVTTLTSWLVIWPNYREAASLRQRIDELAVKVKSIDRQTSELDALASQADEARERIDRDLKLIPVGADVAGLIQKLSLPIDHASVMDQTFTAGSPSDAIVLSSKSAATGSSAEPAALSQESNPPLTINLQAMPLTVDMVARFDSIFALIRAAESMNRLVRITSVRVMCKRDEQKTETPVLRASVGLEAIFEQR